jgi:hypothetical protein
VTAATEGTEGCIDNDLDVGASDEDTFVTLWVRNLHYDRGSQSYANGDVYDEHRHDDHGHI